MKEFNLILDKVAHALNMTVNSVIKLYPQLRTEYSWYYLCHTTQEILGSALIIILALGAMIFIPAIVVNDFEDDDYKKTIKFLKPTLIVVAVLTAIVVTAFVLEAFMCPDIMIIKEFLK